MVVLDRSGDKVGTVVHAYRYDPMLISMAGGLSKLPDEELVEVKTGFLGLGKHLFIPMSAVQDVMNSSVLLSKSSVEIAACNEKPPYLANLR
jgi:hypothetical protein